MFSSMSLVSACKNNPAILHIVIFRDISPEQKSEGEIISLKTPRQKKVNSLAKPESQKKTARAAPQRLIIQDQTNPRTVRRIREIGIILAIACAMLFVIISVHLSKSGLGFKQNIVDSAGAGFEHIISGAMALQETHFEDAKQLFISAQSTFQNIQNKTWFTTPSIPTMTIHDPIFDVTNSLITAGTELAQAGQLFTQVAQNLQFLPNTFFQANSDKLPLSGGRGPLPSLTKKLKEQLPAIISSTDMLLKANTEMQKIPDTFVPAQLRERFRFAKDALATLGTFLQSLKNDIPVLLTLLGDSHPHTFLILLQNNAELRPSGGFIGSYLLLETNDGYITKNEVHDVYSSDHKLPEKITPPPEILPVNNQWFMRDSNYSGHFPLSAAKAAQFLEKEGGPGVDTVIAVDQTLIEQLLELSGPVLIPELSLPLTSGNFSTIISYIVESKISGREDPKAVLKSFVPAFQKTLLKNADPVVLSQIFTEAADGKHILAYSTDDAVENFWQRRGLAGEMEEAQPHEAKLTNNDYLNIVHTSIGGNKSDTYMTEDIHHDTFLQSDGSLTDEVSITRTHHWNDAVENKIKTLVASFGFSDISKNVLEILGRSRNLHMLRIYVPSGAVFESSSDPSVTAQFDKETGRPYFSARMEVPVGESRTLTIRYHLPRNLNLDPVDKYSFTIQKQAGQENITLRKRIFPESRVLNYKFFPESGRIDIDGVLNYETDLKKDMTFTSIWGK